MPRKEESPIVKLRKRGSVKRSFYDHVEIPSRIQHVMLSLLSTQQALAQKQEAVSTNAVGTQTTPENEIIEEPGTVK